MATGWRAVYFDPDHEAAVRDALVEFVNEQTRLHPEWTLDVDADTTVEDDDPPNEADAIDDGPCEFCGGVGDRHIVGCAGDKISGHVEWNTEEDK